jgi:hypothetical protein
MANQEHLAIFKQGVEVWNKWRKEHPNIRPDLSKIGLIEAFHIQHHHHDLRSELEKYDQNGVILQLVQQLFKEEKQEILSQINLWEVDLSRTDLSGASFSEVDLSGGRLDEANLNGVNFEKVNLSEASLISANLSGNFSNANLHRADLSGARLIGVDLSGASIIDTNLIGTSLIGTNLRNAIIRNCSIYGISAWDVKLEGATQFNLVITLPSEPTITVDNLKVAQFIHLLLNNQEIRDVIDSITSKVVLILGRFTNERKAVLDALRDGLREKNYSPVLFDFEKPANRDITETVSTLAHLARFVIADITEPKSISQELSHIVPILPSVPIMPLLQVSEREYGMYEHFISYPWVQPIYHYHDLYELLHYLREHVIDPAEEKVRELAIEKAKRLERP